MSLMWLGLGAERFLKMVVTGFGDVQPFSIRQDDGMGSTQTPAARQPTLPIARNRGRRWKLVIEGLAACGKRRSLQSRLLKNFPYTPDPTAFPEAALLPAKHTRKLTLPSSFLL